MLELKGITKEYITGAESVMALKGVNLAFRESEFVSILGQSGCGKTTLLNIMGGLDQYTDGDLIINGVSTKEYKDADWDAYRNHSIGFVFQSYNLIPHQTVLANVELALTLSGVSPEERRQRAVDALNEVGLGDQINKKPAQMSGGQMQRVAIARALINNPDILLADEPTGALDTETSVQIMNIIKKISKDRLVVMVTHNPDLAKEYSTRIVNLSDGLVTGDSNPFDPAAEASSVNGAGMIKNESMSFKTALQLSLNNLMTKKARTLLTAFAGSIGIIGIALILSVSNGFQHYIDQLENDTLTSYPLTIQSETADMTSMISAFAEGAEETQEAAKGKKKTLTEQQLMSDMLASVGSNDLKTFNNYVNSKLDSELAGCFNNIQYGYGIQPQIYSTSYDYGVLQVCPSNLMSSYMNGMQQTMVSLTNTDIFAETIDNKKMKEEQYEVVAGEWPENYNEMALVLTSKNTMTDYMAYTLGLKDPEELKDMIADIMSGKEVTYEEKPLEWTYDEIMDLEFSLVPASSRYRYNSGYGVWEDMSDDEGYMQDLIDSSEKLHITCIAIPNPDNTSSSAQMGVLYLPSLTEHVIEVAGESDIVKNQRAKQKVDVFSGKTFEALENDEDQALGFADMISIDENKLKKALGGDIDVDTVKNYVIDNTTEALSALDVGEAVQDICTTAATQVSKITGTLASNITESGNIEFTEDDIDKALADNLDEGQHAAVVNNILRAYADELKDMLDKSSKYSADAATAGEKLTKKTQKFIEGTVVDKATAYAETLAIQQTAQNVPSAMANLAQQMGSMFNVDPSGIAGAFSMSMSEEELTRLITSYMSSGSDASYEGNLRTLGYADIDNPYSISYYLHDFDSKEKFMDFIDTYNDDMEKNGDEDLVISYTDITGVLLKSVKKITNAVSYVLIAFVAISLVVSSIMIGVITYISVLERTKEIGILRAIGASKKDISRIFNAETAIIGLCAGVMGIVTSLLLLIPINAILINLTKISTLKAILPLGGAIALILISIALTLIAGLIPSGMASKKDPVVALRTE